MPTSPNIIDLTTEYVPVTGVVLNCKDGTTLPRDVKIHRLFRKENPIIHFIRASNPKNGVVSPEHPEGNGGRVTFSCPVMSRRHARLSFTDQGNITIMDLKSLHGTFRHNPAARTSATRLSPHVEYSLNDGDVITLGKEVFRDNKLWQPVVIKVELLREREETPVEIIQIVDSPSERQTPNRYGLLSPPSPLSPSFSGSDSSSDSSSDDDSDTSPHTSSGSDGTNAEYDPESPVGAARSRCSLLHLGRLPSLRDLGFRDILQNINSAMSPLISNEPHLQASTAYASTDIGEASSSPSIQYPENQLGHLDMSSQTFSVSSIRFQGGGSPEPEVESDEDSEDVNASRHSSPMEISSGASSREASPSPVGAWPVSDQVLLNIGDISKQVMNIFRSPAGLRSSIGPEVDKGKEKATENISSPPVPQPEDCRSNLFLPPILSSPVTFELQNVWQQDSPFAEDKSDEPVERRNAQRRQDNVPLAVSFAALLLKIQDLVYSESANTNDRIQNLKDSVLPLVESQLLLARSASISLSNLNAGSEESALKASSDVQRNADQIACKQELQSIRDELLRFSTILEQVLAKVEPSKTQERSVAGSAPDIVMQDAGQREMTPQSSSQTANSLSTSGTKRKRDDELECIGEDESPEESLVVEVLPSSKRQRRNHGAEFVKGIASAAGYTTLGAVATWATLAYCV